MKKGFRNYISIWAILLVLFQVIAFMPAGWDGAEKYTRSFWSGYLSVMLAFGGQLACASKVFREENLKKRFYHLSLLSISYYGLILSFMIGGICMFFPVPYWVGTITCAIVLAFTAITIMKACIAIELVEETDEKVKERTSFIRLLTVDAENLLSCAKTDRAKAACKKVYEAARYSDPVSSGVLTSIEEKITVQMEALTKAVTEGIEENIVMTADELAALISERAQKCKGLK